MIHASPAYGRDYTTQKAVRADWEAGKDFTMQGLHRGYINKADAENYGVPEGSIMIRYNRLQKFVIVEGLPLQAAR